MNSRFYPSLLLFGLMSLSCSILAADDYYEVQTIEDGDTLKLEIEGKSERIQLRGIDAPESVKNPKLERDIQRTRLTADELLTLGRAASEHLSRLAAPGTQVSFKGDLGQRDRYGRISAILEDGSGQSINEAMVADGFAVTLLDPGLPKTLGERLKQAEAQARKNKSGIWGTHPINSALWAGTD